MSLVFAFFLFSQRKSINYKKKRGKENVKKVYTFSVDAGNFPYKRVSACGAENVIFFYENIVGD